jgi:hypothetical protein
MTCKRVAQSLAVLGMVALVIAAPGAGGQDDSTVPGLRSLFLPAARIISLDETVGLLETTSGAVYRLNGNLDNSSAALTWQLRVPPVSGPTSGLLEIQRPDFNRPDATFLVDIVSGRTWILRRRAAETGTWEPVDVGP